MNEIVLASASIGRKKLFQKYFTDFKVSVSNIDESKIKITEPRELTKRLAYLKSTAISKFYHDDFVIGFDTVVLCDGQILGKPKTKEEAKEVLRFLCGKEQDVITGYSIINLKKKLDVNEFCETRLFFKQLSDEFIMDYVSNHPVTKFAGGYGVQDNDSLVDVMDGDFENVIGAPMHTIISILKKHGLSKQHLKSSLEPEKV